MAGCLSATNSASAPHRRFFSNMRNSAQIPLRTCAVAFCRFTDLRTAFVPAFETFYDMSHSIRTFCFFYCTERVDESSIKAPATTSKCRLTTSEDAWAVYTSSQLCAFSSRFVTTLFLTKRDIQKRSDMAVMHYNNPPLSNGSRQPRRQDYGAPQESRNHTAKNYTPRR